MIKTVSGHGNRGHIRIARFARLPLRLSGVVSRLHQLRILILSSRLLLKIVLPLFPSMNLLFKKNLKRIGKGTNDRDNHPTWIEKPTYPHLPWILFRVYLVIQSLHCSVISMDQRDSRASKRLPRRLRRLVDSLVDWSLVWLVKVALGLWS